MSDAQYSLTLEATPSSRERVLESLAWWEALGWLRALDAHFVRFLAEHDAQAPAEVLLAAALASHQLGRGHVCLALSRALAAPRDVLSLPPLEESAPQAEVPLPEDFLQGLDSAAWAARLAESPLVAPPGPGTTPLVLAGERLYLRRYWSAERSVAAHLGERLGRPLPVEASLAEPLARLFATNATHDDTPDWQKVACTLALRNRLTIISGGPGTGKTTTVTRLLALLQTQALSSSAQGLRIQLAAPTGKAAARLSASIAGAVKDLDVGDDVQAALPREALTLHRLLGARPDTRRFRHHAGHPLSLDLLVVDEASMVDLELMAALLEAMPAEARLILLGDKDQLASVEAGSVLGDLCANALHQGYSPPACEVLERLAGISMTPDAVCSPLADHVVMLRKSYRFDAHSGIGALAAATNAGDVAAFRRAWDAGYADIDWLAASRDQAAIERAAVAGYRALYRRIAAGATATEVLERLGDFQVLCALKRGPWGVEGLNAGIATRLWREGCIDDHQGWYAGRPVMVTRNDPQLGVYNGDIGIVLPAPEAQQRLRVFFATSDGVRAVLPSRLEACETVFAMTVHKSQGSEFAHVLFVLPEHATPILTRELVYTGITRAKRQLTLAGGDTRVMDSALHRRVVRDSGFADWVAALEQEERS
ncbi:DNA helicase/exodeoxyribonuclease V alpha subunit [Chromohalobacter marismortui]|uniref:RecBCD enzyme subunit RecD n=1 Tax=Chromohalobacter marismortui TaxID=42055 RepID=A0A4R7NVA7_9GAMM|nr:MULTISPECIES: exodeoxyribonuclease V subunit alpha [Chromohalobacter]MCI0510731.1 exodeoxyribonuclease V subunit alpha [Chromohalobacter sp.]MCI0593947.1 exodeoxyribonuclease V subunit alpha [Chromohalobacter sp.]TDU24692.1 DNA helicase/exodeoxyribonuclease V alpha subunit [Chromohalobacter marismortui]